MEMTVVLKKSLIGRNKKHRATAHSLGLRRIGDSCRLQENDANKGKIALIHYLIEISSQN